MAPFKSSLARSAGKLFGVFKERDLLLRGNARTPYSTPPFFASGGFKIDASPTVHYHVFVSNSPFNVTVGGVVDIFLVAGGGGASTSLSGGGGGGGAVHVVETLLESGVEYDVIVGAGGVENDASAPSSSIGNSGANSTFTHPVDSTVLTALGGGYGASYAVNNAANGGSGGGKETGSDAGGLGQQPSQSQPFHTSHGGTLNLYGNNGGIAPGPGNYGGGGGGAGGAGSGVTAGAGQPFTDFPAPVLAPAIPSPTRTRWSSEVGTTGLFGGGGGGGARDGYSAGKGGTGGGGDGYNVSPQESSDGASYTGGGGGSGSYPYGSGENGAGGNGIVIIRYVD
jgi:hypothetical protein